MFLSKKPIIIICIIAALVIGITAGCLIYDLKLRGDGIKVRDKALFGFDAEDVTYVQLMTGYGDRRGFEEKEELEGLASRLKEIKYNKVKLDIPTQGYTYHMTVYYDSKGREKSDQFIILSSGAVKHGDRIYYLTPESKPIIEEIIALMPQ